MDIRTPEFVAVGSDAQRVHPDNATSGATFTRTAQPSREQDNPARSTGSTVGTIYDTDLPELVPVVST
jgi:hypothetical protein